MRILIVEDDMVIADGLMTSMRQAGHVSDWSKDGEEADFILTQHGYDLIILDLALPCMDGLHVLDKLRKRGNKTPVLILTARDALEERIKGLDLGADDYLTKPFDLLELEARIRALLRRGQCGSTNELCLGPLSFNTAGRRVIAGDHAIVFASRELSVLELFMRNSGSVVTKRQILEHLCGWDDDVSENAIEVYIHRIRKKLEGTGVQIQTIRGLGYLINSSRCE